MKKTGFIFFALFLALIQLLSTNSTAISGERPRIGLVLGGGGAKGFAHIGVLQMLDSLQIPIDMIAGTSMGGISAALYSIGYDGREQEVLARTTDWAEIFTDLPERALLPYFQRKEQGRYQLTFGLKGVKPIAPMGLIYGQKISLLFSSLTSEFQPVVDFDDLPIPLRLVSVDLLTGNVVVHGKGSLPNAMRATMSIPTVFTPVEWGDSLLVDGGLINNLPVDVVKAMGADFVITVDVGTPLQKRDEIKSGLALINQIMAIYDRDRWQRNVEMTNIFIQPQIGDFSPGDFERSKIDEIIRRGKIAAKKHLPELAALKQKLNQSGSSVSPETDANPAEVATGKSIYGITVEGNHLLPFSFIYRLLGLRPGVEFKPEILNQRIMELYALGYFETVQYEIEPVTKELVRLKLLIKEKPLRQLRVGLRYDDLREMVASVDLLATNLLLPGLRWEYELQFAGLTRSQFKVCYPSRTMHVSVYPYLKQNFRDYSTYIFDLDGSKIARYNDQTSGYALGGGVLLGKSTNLEVEYQFENLDIEAYIAVKDPERFPDLENKLSKIKLNLDYDTVDDILLPRKGQLVHFQAEDNLKRLGSDFSFIKMHVSADFYQTLHRKHTLRLHGFWGMCTEQTPVYNYLNRGYPDYFVGVDYNEMVGTRLSIGRLEYRYEYKKDIFFSLIVNSAFQYQYRLARKTYTSNNIWGVGLGVKLLSPIGPIDFIYARGPNNLYCTNLKSDKFYVKLGYHF